MSANGPLPGDWIAGLRLLQSRSAAIPDLLRIALTSPIDQNEIVRSIGPGGIVATGVGSSAAHARFLVSVLGELSVPARFVPLGAFLEPPPVSVERQTLVIFSQGLSPNARLALARAERWRSVWLATATGGDAVGSQTAPGGDDDTRRRALDDAISDGARVLSYPGANEFGTLLRIIGPMTAYAVALRFAAAASGSTPPWAHVDTDEVCGVVARAPERLRELAGDLGADDLERNIVLLASGTHAERIDNLRLKILEGALRPAPPVCEMLDFAHGPFQQMFAGAATIVALARADAADESEMLARVAAMLDAGRHRLVTLTSGLPGPYAIFEHEALMNALVLRIIEERRIDACDWPGKDRDSPLYSCAATSADAAQAPVASPRQREATTNTRRLEELTWPELEQFLTPGQRTAILPLGSIEQHGPHLPFATDAWIASELARRLTSRLPEAIELPVVSFGCASEHMAFPGTLSLGDETLAAVLCDVARSVARHGFSRLFVFSAHGGNRDALARALPKMREAAGNLEILAAPGLGATMQQLHDASARHDVAPDASGHHAGEFETSILLRLAPRSVRSERIAPGFIAGARDLDGLFYPDLRTSAPTGTVGDPTGAAASRAEAYLEAWVESLLEIYRREENWK